MSTYPGNIALSNAVKERVVSTFQQTLALYKQGRTDEVVQGCTLILRMDPVFEPAKKLMEKARNPNAPIDVEALARQLSADPMAAAREAMAQRNFQKVIDLTTEVLTNDLMNDEARVLNEKAREKMEAAPFVDQFIKKAQEAIQKGDAAGARASIDKIKSLDADDTMLARLEQSVSAIKSPAAAASQSFIVETPKPAPGSGRGAAQASDFGFTFEEDKGGAQSFSFDSPFSTDTGTVPAITPPPGFDSPKPAAPAKPPAQAKGPDAFSFDTPPPPSPGFSGGFSFDTPTPAAPAAPPAKPAGAAPGSFDFATASIETTPDDQKKIQQYLADGDKSFDAGDFQGAIDLWSRIFLIDVTNDAASERIEKAKKKKREAEERGEKMPASVPGELVATEGGAGAFATPYTPPEPTPANDVFADEIPMAHSAVPPAPVSAATAAAPKKAAPSKAKAAPAPSSGSSMRLAVIAFVAVVLAGAGYFGWKKFMSGPKTDPAATEAIFRSATSLSQKGQYDAAIALLQDVKANDPQHDRALQMMADLQQKKGQGGPKPAMSDAAYRDALASAKASFDAHDYDAAKKGFDVAARVKPLPPDMQALYDQASQQVSKLEGAKQLFNEQRYQDALTSLQSLEQQDPQNASIKRLISDAHFNLGAVALQEEKLDDAAAQFGEVLKHDPNDELAKRSKALAERYKDQPKDLLYKIYVKYLPLRKVA